MEFYPYPGQEGKGERGGNKREGRERKGERQGERERYGVKLKF